MIKKQTSRVKKQCIILVVVVGMVVVVVVVKYLRGKTGNLMRPTGNGGFL